MALTTSSAFERLSALYKWVTGGNPWSGPLFLARIVGFVVLAVFAFGLPHKGAVPIALLLAGCAMAVGSLLGFLFGVPRTVRRRPEGGVPREAPGFQYHPNTNLEQISDWLTKIIVGLGLVELHTIPKAYMSMAIYVSDAFGAPPVASSLTAVIMLYFGITGFLSCYLWTRLFLFPESPCPSKVAAASDHA
jgi:hypothetical protein